MPPMRARKNSDKCIFLEADTYQAASLNIKLPNGVRLLEEDYVHKQMVSIRKKNAIQQRKQQQMERQEKVKKQKDEKKREQEALRDA